MAAIQQDIFDFKQKWLLPVQVTNTENKICVVVYKFAS